MATVDVRLFAGLRERAGTGRATVEVEPGAPVAAVWDLLGLGERPPGIAYAVNRAYVEADHALADGDEVALIPPVSGGSEAPRIGVRLSPDPLDIADLHARANDPRAGAQAAFTGTVRNRTAEKEVLRLEYEAYDVPLAGPVADRAGEGGLGARARVVGARVQGGDVERLGLDAHADARVVRAAGDGRDQRDLVAVPERVPLVHVG
ncbi:MAG: hypothetical protein RL190_1557, partial [Actinomycetota bacterium]